MDLNKQKSELRKEFLAIRRNLPDNYRRKANQVICRNLLELPEMKSAQVVGGYVSDGFEVDLSELIVALKEKGVKCGFPRYREEIVPAKYEIAEILRFPEDLTPGMYGLLEPCPKLPGLAADDYENLIWLVPGVVFDRQGGRLGRGKGVYDRLLRHGGRMTIGVFYDKQQIAAVPCMEHDYHLDMIVTESGVVRCKSKRR